MQIRKIEDIKPEEIIQILENHGIIIYPTETCYGIGCNPSDTIAVAKLLKYKTLRNNKPISIAVADKRTAENYVNINQTASDFYDRFLPGPFTIISKSLGKVAEGIGSNEGTLGIRIPDYPWLLKLLKKYGKAITSTSANRSYQKSPYKIQDILNNASQKHLDLIDLIIDAGTLPQNPSSTVVDTSKEEIEILRKGKIIPEGAKVKEFSSKNVEDTMNFAEELVKNYSKDLEKRPIIFALQGDMGAGKTHFTKGIARAVGINDDILSPTFIISKEYENSNTNLIHIDTWRLENISEFNDLKIVDLIKNNKKNIFVFEWADRVMEQILALDINKKIIWIEIKNGEGANERQIRWSE